jgi:glutathione S-transferase
MNLHGHPWSINTRKTLATIAEKGHDVPMTLVMLPKGEHLRPQHLRLHPFGKVPVLDDDGFVLYEARAINGYLDAKLSGPRLVPADARGRAEVERWINVADAYFVPSAHSLIVELLFRRYLGGTQDAGAIERGRDGIARALDTLDSSLATSPFIAGDAFSLADVHWMPYLEYMQQIGESALIEQRPNLRAWWLRVSARPSWHRVARTGPQPYEVGMTADAVEKLYR